MISFVRPLIVSVSLLLASCASANQRRASNYFREGVRAHRSGQLHEAAASFDRAYAISPSADVLFNLGRVYEELGDAVNAGRCYVAFLRESETAAPERRRSVDVALVRVHDRVAWLLITSALPARIDGAVVARVRHGDPVAIAPGRHVVTFANQPPVVVVARAESTISIVLDANTQPRISVVATPAPRSSLLLRHMR